MNRKHIVFDFGAVLFQWQPAQLLQRVLPQRAHDADAAQRWVRDFFQNYSGDWGDFDRGTVTVPDLVQRISQRTGLAPFEVQAVVDAVPHELQAVPATVALLRRLHRAGHSLHYLSNMPEPYAQHLERTHDFFACFSGGVFSSRVHSNKPEAAIYALAQQRFGVAPNELVFLDDLPSNVAAAQAHGWNAVVFENAPQAQAQMQAQGLIGDLL
jgi:putative hydrolase of the HAD superfamily